MHVLGVVCVCVLGVVCVCDVCVCVCDVCMRMVWCMWCGVVCVMYVCVMCACMCVQGERRVGEREAEKEGGMDGWMEVKGILMGRRWRESAIIIDYNHKSLSMALNLIGAWGTYKGLWMHVFDHTHPPTQAYTITHM